MDVRKWLEDMGLGEHAPVFEENAIKAAEDLDLTAEDLKELGVAKLGRTGPCRGVGPGRRRERLKPR